MQEAFVAALLVIARMDDGPGGGAVAEGPAGLRTLYAQGPFVAGGEDDGELEKLVLWREIKKQIKILREEMGEKE